MARVRPLLLALLLLPLPLGAVSASDGGVEGPLADGSYTLTYHVQQAAAGSVPASLDVTRTDADGALRDTRDLGPRTLAAGANRIDVSFLPAEGAGRYDVALLLDGIRVGEVSFHADEAGATRVVAFSVADEPTYLNLTNEDVNAPLKLKSPGEALVTRARISDANGLADVDGVSWRVERGGVALYTGALPWSPGSATSADLELRFDRSPIPAGEHTLRLVAHRGGMPLASAARTFVIREVAPTLASGALETVVPDANHTQDAFLVLADKNGPPEGVLETRVYRASTRVEGQGFSAVLGGPTRGPDADGAARVTYPLTLRTPDRATAGAYRVSFYHDGALVGSLPFEVRALPTLRSVNLTTAEGALRLEASGTGDGVLLARLVGDGARVLASAPFVNGSGAVAFDALPQGGALRWTLALHAREAGPALDARDGNWSRPASGAPIHLTPLHVRARLPAAWAIDAGRPTADANATWSFSRWDGAPEPRLVGELRDGRARISSPSDLAAGRYTARLRLAWADGQASEATWTFDAGPWVELALGEPVVEGREARLPVRNAGGVTVQRLVVESAPAAALQLRVGNASYAATPLGARSQFDAPPLAPGEEAQLVVRLADGALRSGRHEVAVRVLAKVALG